MFADPEDIERSITQSVIDYIGYKGLADSGMMVLKDKLSIKEQKGLIRVAHKAVDNLRVSLMLTGKIDNQEVIVRTVGISGIMKKAYDNFVSG
jgi:RNase P/RNase MRP subunit POP5